MSYFRGRTQYLWGNVGFLVFVLGPGSSDVGSRCKLAALHHRLYLLQPCQGYATWFATGIRHLLQLLMIVVFYFVSLCTLTPSSGSELIGLRV